MAISGVEEFLRAEDEAYRLVDELEKLKKEVESYSTARESLERAQQALTQLAVRIGDLAARSAVVIDTMLKIGTPEILGRLEQLNGSVIALQGRLSDIQGSLGSAIDGTRREMKGLGERVDSAIDSQNNQFRRLFLLTIISASVLLVLIVITIGLLLTKA